MNISMKLSGVGYDCEVAQSLYALLTAPICPAEVPAWSGVMLHDGFQKRLQS